MYVKDFDGNGAVEQIISMYNGGVSYPLPLRDDLLQRAAVPQAALPDLQGLRAEDGHGHLHAAGAVGARVAQEGVHLRDVAGAQQRRRIVHARAAAGRGAARAGVRNSRRPTVDQRRRSTDLLLAGNFDGFKPEIGRMSASYGLLLRGDGTGSSRRCARRRADSSSPARRATLRACARRAAICIVVSAEQRSPLVFRAARTTSPLRRCGRRPPGRPDARPMSFTPPLMNVLNRHVAAVLAAAVSVIAAPALAQAPLTVASPDSRTAVHVEIRGGHLVYSVTRDRRALLLPSMLGFEFRGAPTLRDGLRITGTRRVDLRRDVDAAVGRGRSRARSPQRAAGRRSSRRRLPAGSSTFVVRAFNDGIGFRYEVPAQPALGDFEISDELTEFTFADNAKSWWIPSNRPRLDRSECLYSSSPVSVIDSMQTPFTMETRDGKTFHGDSRGESRRLCADVPGWPAHGRVARCKSRSRPGRTATRCAVTRRS